MSNRPNTRTSRVPRAEPPPAQGRPWWLLGVFAVILVIAVAVGLSASGGGDDEAVVLPGGTIPTGETVVASSDAAYGEILAVGAALPRATEGGDDPAVGQAAPSVEGVGFDGGTVTAPIAGEPTVVMFLAHWCPHCQAEVPRVVEWLSAEGMPEGVRFVAVATSNDPSAANFPAGEWLNREGWTVPTMLDDEAQSAAAAFGIGGFPYFVAVDAEGTVVARASGEIGVEGVQGLIASATAGTT